jgi:hypothetical protein
MADIETYDMEPVALEVVRSRGGFPDELITHDIAPLDGEGSDKDHRVNVLGNRQRERREWNP